MIETQRVEHPSHYTSHPSGVECIKLIRHYTCDIANVFKYLWRAGLKDEQGLSRMEKEREDCDKALWYLNDHLGHLHDGHYLATEMLRHPSGLRCEDIAGCFCENVAAVFRELWFVGLVYRGFVVSVPDEEERVRRAIGYLRSHIASLG